MVGVAATLPELSEWTLSVCIIYKASVLTRLQGLFILKNDLQTAKVE